MERYKNLVWLSINSDALIKPGEFNPYAAVLSFSDITTFISTQNELKESNERFRYISSITSDAIWDFDLTENTIYRSETFSRISGYPKSDINMNLNWWFDKIHPEDQARVKEKLEERLRLKNERWNDEYRFCYADGSYKMLKDSGIILYKDEKPVRIIGAISDITEEAKLKQQLIHEQTQKQKAVAKAALNAQEDEKARISRELHDNVNQIIMSAKLYMETARQAPENADKLLDKAIEYQLLALHEIRKLSKTLNTSAITGSDLKESIGDIVRNLEALQNIAVKLEIDSLTEKKLNEKAKLTVYRVIQEQTNNIIKYASATEVRISVKIIDGNAELVIADNGKGFEMSKKEGFTGIGLINMNSRAMAVDGSFDIKSSPGNGCVVIVRFPLSA
jgi:PAS domain S-box-containing protein